MDGRHSEQSQQQELGSWHPALRPNTHKDEDGSRATTAVDSLSYPKSSEDNAIHGATSFRLPFRPKSRSRGRSLTDLSFAASSRKAQSPEDVGLDLGGGAGAFQAGADSPSNMERRQNSTEHRAGEQMDVVAAPETTLPVTTDLADVTEKTADKPIQITPQEVSSTINVESPNHAPLQSPGHQDDAFGDQAEMDRVWELEEKGKSNDNVTHAKRTNSFPVVPPTRRAGSKPPSSLPHSQAENIVEGKENGQFPSLGLSGGAGSPTAEDEELSTDPFAPILDEGDETFFANLQSGEGFIAPTEADEESRYEEGLPLMATTSSDHLNSHKNISDIRSADNSAVEMQDGFLDEVSLGPGEEASAFHPHPLDRKSTAQVLSSMHYPPQNATRSKPEIDEDRISLSSVDNDGNVTSARKVNGLPTTQPEERKSELKPKNEDLAELWKAALDDDDFLEEDEDSVDPSAFFGDGGDDFLKEDQDKAGEPQFQPTAYTAHTLNHDAAIRLKANGETKSRQTRSSNKYLPETVAQPAPYPQAAPSANFSHPSELPPLASARPRTQPSSSTQTASRPQMPPSTQSFADKSKGGYTSPYDLPMDVTRPKKRNAFQQVRPSSDAQLSSIRPPPPRSSSMFTGAPSPVDPQPPVPRRPNAYLGAKPVDAIPPALKASPSTGSFFEELPSTKSRPPSSMGTFTPPATHSNPTLSPPSHLGPLNQFSPPQPSSLNAFKQPQQYELVPPEKLSLYGNTSQAESSGRAIPTMSARYSPAPVQSSIIPPPQNRYAVSPAAGSRPPISQTLPFQPRTSSPLATNNSPHPDRQQAFESESSPRRPHSSSKQNTFSRDLGNPSFPVPQTRDPQVVDPKTYRNDADTNMTSSREWKSLSPSPSNIQHGGSSTSASDSSYTMNPPEPDQFSRDSSSSLMQSRATPTFDAEIMARGPLRRSQTQSPSVGKYAPQSVNAEVPYQRPASASHQVSNPFGKASVPHGNPARQVAGSPSDGFNYIRPADGRELDPLDRWKGCPLFSFGFGGAIVTSFPKQIPRFATGHAAPMIKCSPGEIKLQDGRILPFEEDVATFPGPLKSKSKKKDVVEWMNKRISKLEDGSSLLAGSSSLPDLNKCHEEKTLLWKIVRVLVEHDGVLDGNPMADQAVRRILSPELMHGDTAVLPSQDSNTSLLGIAQRSGTRTVSGSLNPEAMEDLRKILLHGEREKAIWHAVDNRLWAHAMLLSSTVDQSIWKQVSQEFVRQEVKTYGENTGALAALYQIFAGNFEESADELVPPSARAGLQLVSKTASTGPTKNALDGLDRWRETLTLILSNRTPGDGKALVSVGQLLAGYGRIEAAHICYIFAKSPGLFGGPDEPNVSVALLGADHLQNPIDYGRDIDCILLTEVYDFARTVLASSSVAIVSPHLQALKLYHAVVLAEYGYRSEAQQYCEIIASTLSSTTKRSPYYHGLLLEALNGLTDRLRQAPRDNTGSWISKPSIDKVSGSIWAKFNQYVAGDESDAASVGSGKGHDSSAGPFAGVAGESPSLSRAASTNDLYNSYGPGVGFTPTAPTANSSNPRYAPTGLYTPRSSFEQQGRPNQDLPRSGPNDSLRPAPFHQQFQSRPNSSTSSYNEPFKSGFTASTLPSRTESYLPTPPLQPQHMSQAVPNQPSTSLYEHDAEQPTLPSEHQGLHGLQQHQDDQLTTRGCEPSYSSNISDHSAYEPPAFNPYEPPALSGYDPPSHDTNISQMEEFPSEGKPKKKSYMDDDNDEDFEARAAALRQEEKARKDREADEAFRRAAEVDGMLFVFISLHKLTDSITAQKDKAPKLNNKKSGWFGGWLGGKKPDSEDTHGTPNAPIKAKLGEQSSFYYDSEQKRWINKKDPDTTPAAKAAPPPPRSTPSRAVSAAGPSPTSTSTTPPVPPLSAAAAMSGFSSSNPPSQRASPGSSPAVGATLKQAIEAEMSGGPSGPPSAPPSRPATSMSGASSIDDLIGVPQARKGGTIKKGKKKGYVDIMAK